MKKQAFLGSLGSIALLITTVHGVYANPINTMDTIDTATSLDHPLGIKVIITTIGLTLIGLELWWFLARQKKTD